jgi:hypothetical protein
LPSSLTYLLHPTDYLFSSFTQLPFSFSLISSSHTFCLTCYVAFPQHIPSPHFLLPYWRQPYTFTFLLGQCLYRQRELVIAFHSCSGLLTLWFSDFYFFSFLPHKPPRSLPSSTSLYLPFHLSLYIFPTSHLNVSSP